MDEGQRLAFITVPLCRHHQIFLLRRLLGGGARFFLNFGFGFWLCFSRHFYIVLAIDCRRSTRVSSYTIYIFLLSSSFPRVFYFLGPTFSPARDDVEMRLACRAGSLHFFVACWVLLFHLLTTTPTYGALATESGRWGNDSEWRKVNGRRQVWKETGLIKNMRQEKKRKKKEK